MKRIICTVLALMCCIFSVASLASCNDESENGGEQSSNNPFYVVYKDVKIELNKSAEEVLEKMTFMFKYYKEMDVKTRQTWHQTPCQ